MGADAGRRRRHGRPPPRDRLPRARQPPPQQQRLGFGRVARPRAAPWRGGGGAAGEGLISWPIGWRRVELRGGSNGRSVLGGCVDSTGPGYRRTRAEDAAQASLIRQQNEVPGNRQSTLALAA